MSGHFFRCCMCYAEGVKKGFVIGFVRDSVDAGVAVFFKRESSAYRIKVKGAIRSSESSAIYICDEARRQG